jgi:flagellar assembly protein FliH
MNTTLDDRGVILRAADLTAAGATLVLGGVQVQASNSGKVLSAASSLADVAAVPAAFDRGFEQAQAAGYQAGFERGQAEARQSAASQIESSRAVLEERLAALDELKTGLQSALDVRHRKLVLDAEADLLELVFDLLCRFIGEQAVCREGLLALIRQAAQSVPAPRIERLRVSPADLALLTGCTAPGLPGLAGAEPNWQADPAVDPGGCIVDCAEGSLDARLGGRLERLRGALLAAHAARGYELQTADARHDAARA